MNSMDIDRVSNWIPSIDIPSIPLQEINQNHQLETNTKKTRYATIGCISIINTQATYNKPTDIIIIIIIYLIYLLFWWRIGLLVS